MNIKEEKKLIEKSVNYRQEEAKMTLSQIKDKYFPNRSIDDLRGVVEKRSKIIDQINKIIQENKK